ncbi:hypothetical protein [Haliangium sp.]|uniref:hypothetical protein n=1 Tax=Haliangium sp. TaxID=2663208 RepID=UPI003D0C00EE
MAAFLLAASGLIAAPAWAGDVVGSVKFEPNRLGKPPMRNQGFLPRIENPLRPVKSFDPRGWMVVVLEGGPAAEDASSPTGTIRYELVGESFVIPLLAVVAGTQVELKNLGFGAPTLSTPDQPTLLEEVVLDSASVKAFTVTEPLQPVTIRAQGSPHLQGQVVAFPHRYFSLVDERGGFEIPNVPPGQWTARVWYRDGWVKGVSESVVVGPRRSSVTVEVSPVLEVERP